MWRSRCKDTEIFIQLYVKSFEQTSERKRSNNNTIALLCCTDLAKV